MSRQKRNKNIESSIKEIISFYVGAPLKDISLTDSIESLGGDSLDFVEIVLEIEDKFAVLIPAEDADKFKNIGELIRYVKKNK
jgi:acyl carrier protein